MSVFPRVRCHVSRPLFNHFNGTEFFVFFFFFGLLRLPSLSPNRHSTRLLERVSFVVSVLSRRSYLILQTAACTGCA